VKLLVVLVLLDALQYGPVGDTGRLQEGREVIHAEVPVRAAVGLARAGRVLGEDLLAAVGAVAAAAAIGVASDVAVDVPHVVAVLLVEGVVGDLAESLSPKDETLLQVEPDALEEECVLQPPVVLEVGVPP